ncbi:MAG: hypothetical protein CSA81_01460 [Acidobacteria bacterium]|nr:MAG: hypothetical protein CSA81_01460 [Acidobacteriota bacterium]PIE89012.1 MAG: hypothetical protein CR997_13520 [Acidobacteriota bacterium]
MNPEIYTATQGLVARQYQLDITAQNIANANTAGYRGTNSFFYAYNDAMNAGHQNVLNSMANNQPILTGTFISSETGPIKHTGGAYDLALEGPGFFKLKTPFGTRYTRRGHFRLNAEGALTNEQGYYVLDNRNRRILLDETPLEVSQDGFLYQNGIEKGQISVVELTNPENLVPEEDVLIASTDPNQVELPARARIARGFLESSNVNIAKEMVSLIRAQRAYEMNNDVIKTIDRDLNQKMIQTFGSIK